MDAVMYCTAALEKVGTMSAAELQKVAFEIATVGMSGINPNDSTKRYRLTALPGEFSGLQLLSYFYGHVEEVSARHGHRIRFE